MKTKEELNALKEEVETLNNKLAELSEDEMEEVTGGWNTGFMKMVSTLEVLNLTALKGKTVGVCLSTDDSRPGAAMSIRVRGFGTIGQSKDTFVTVDGAAN